MKTFFIYSLVLFVLITCMQQAKAQPKAFDILEADSLLAKGNKDVLIFMYTDWCRYCAAMKKTTFKNGSVIQLLNREFNYVPFNAESRIDVKMNGHVYRYVPAGNGTGQHELAAALSGKAVPQFPFVAILNKKGELVFSYDSYLGAKELETVLNSLVQQKQ